MANEEDGTRTEAAVAATKHTGWEIASRIRVASKVDKVLFLSLSCQWR